MNVKKNICLVLIGGLLFMFFISGFNCSGKEQLSISSRTYGVPFDSDVWKNVKLYFSDSTRYEMYDDLINKYKLIGMTKEEIVELLGPQSDPAYFKDWDLRYWLGREPGIGIDSIWLVIKLENNKVIYFKTVTD